MPPRARAACRLLVLCFALSFALLGPAHSAEPRKVRYVIALPVFTVILANQTSLPKALGYYAEEGLEVETVPAGSGGVTATAQFVHQGHQDVGSGTQSPIVARAAEGHDLGLVFFYNQVRDFHYVIGVPAESEVREIAQLKGRSVGVISLASEGAVTARFMARQSGLDPQKDLSLIAVGVGAQALHFLRTGQVAAISNLPGAFAQMEILGQKFRYLPVPPGTDKVFGPGLFARREFLDKNRRVAIGIGRAVAKSTLFMLTNPEAAVRIHWKAYPEQVPRGVPEDKALADAMHVLKVQMDGLQFRADERERLWGHYAAESWQAYLRLYGYQDKLRDASRLYTNEFVAEINAFDARQVIERAKNFRF